MRSKSCSTVEGVEGMQRLVVAGEGGGWEGSMSVSGGVRIFHHRDTEGTEGAQRGMRSVPHRGSECVGAFNAWCEPIRYRMMVLTSRRRSSNYGSMRVGVRWTKAE